jgi:predicted CXXCH cytochrome family protein
LNKLSTQPAASQSECKQSTGNAAQKMLDCANRLTQQTLESSVFRQDKDCGECHEISRTGDGVGDWKLAPVKSNRDWYPSSVFPHAKHNATECSTCHDKTNSKSSADISMPGIALCRECHTGEREEKYKITSGCNTCHTFHGGNRHVWTKRTDNPALQQ